MSNYQTGTTLADIERFEGAPTWFEYFIEEKDVPEDVEIADLWSDYCNWSNWNDGDVDDWWDTIDESQFNDVE